MLPALPSACLTILLLAPPVFAASSARAPHVDVELVADLEALAPGAAFTLGVRYQVEPGWHVYWKNPGDSGIEPKLRWRLPDGFEVGELQWPSPKLIRLKHLANYGYEGEVLLLVDVKAPRAFRPGQSVEIGASLSWLVCKETCIPGEARLTLELPVASAQRLDPGSVERFTAARSRMPLTGEEAGWSARASLERTGVHLELRPEAGASWPKGLQFFPAVGGWVHAAGLQLEAAGEGSLHLFVPLLEDPDREPPGRLSGVAVASGGWRGPGSESGLAIEVEWSGDLPSFAELAARERPMGASLAALLAFLGGLLLNLMPCVLPVLSLKVLALAKIAGEGRRSSLVHAGFFSAGVIATFWSVAAVLLVLRGLGEQLGWGFQLQSPVMVALLAALFTLLSLNLFGVFELRSPLPGRGMTPSGRGDRLSAFSSGILATLVATPCTAPFMGGAVGAALVGPPWLALVVFTALGAGMALPFLLLAACPPLLALVPKPGRWMESLRQALGFVLLATVAWLAWLFGNLVDASGEPVGVDGLAGLLAGLLLLGLGAWLFGRFATPSAAPIRRGLAQALALLAVLLGLVLPLRAVTSERDRLDWEPWSPERVESLESKGAPYLLDFTADWCLSCQVNEQVALDRPAVREALERHGITALKADWTNRDARITEALGRLGRASVPVYVLDGGEGSQPRLLPNILTESLVLDAVEDVMRQAR